MRHFKRIYSAPTQIVHADLDTLSLDVLKLMKDVVGGTFDTNDLADAIVGYYGEENDPLRLKLNQVFDHLREKGFIESFCDSAPQTIIIVTALGNSIKQISEEDDAIVHERHFQQMTESMTRELISRDLPTPDSILAWAIDAEKVIRDHAGTDVARPMTDLIQSTSNGWAKEFDSKRILGQCLGRIKNPYTQLPPSKFNPQATWNDLVQRAALLSHRWSAFTYRGRPVGAPTILRWLKQFKSSEQSYMFQLLDHFDPISEQRIRDFLDVLHREIASLINRPQIKLLVSAGSRPGKSGSRYARMFQQERRHRVHDLPITDIPNELAELARKYDALVFVDDLVGSGATALELIKQLSPYTVLQTSNRTVYICCLCITESGLEELKDAADEAPFQCHVVPFKLVKKCFSDEGGMFIFGSLAHRDRALYIAENYGQKLRPKAPLGFDDGQLLLTFDDNCPDNTLPIIHAVPTADSELQNWIPLFPRSEGQQVD